VTGARCFLDEIANVPKQTGQTARVLETGRWSASGPPRPGRWTFASFSDQRRPEGYSAEGRFRSDLLFRLNTVELPFLRCASGVRTYRCWRRISQALFRPLPQKKTSGSTRRAPAGPRTSVAERARTGPLGGARGADVHGQHIRHDLDLKATSGRRQDRRHESLRKSNRL